MSHISNKDSFMLNETIYVNNIGVCIVVVYKETPDAKPHCHVIGTDYDIEVLLDPRVYNTFYGIKPDTTIIDFIFKEECGPKKIFDILCNFWDILNPDRRILRDRLADNHAPEPPHIVNEDGHYPDRVSYYKLIDTPVYGLVKIEVNKELIKDIKPHFHVELIDGSRFSVEFESREYSHIKEYESKEIIDYIFTNNEELINKLLPDYRMLNMED